MLSPSPVVVFLLDVDNTLLDNDHFAADLDARLKQDFGTEQAGRYWALYSALRDLNGFADYLGALQQFRVHNEDKPALLGLSAFLLEYPFAERFYPRALAVIEHLRVLGTTVIFSDGDIVFQPRKIQRSGLWEAVHGRVMVCLHKEDELDLVRLRFPARHYVAVDDKPVLLAAMKRVLGKKLTTVHVQQGHYASVEPVPLNAAPDVTVTHIGSLIDLTLADFHASPVVTHRRQKSTTIRKQP